MSHDYNAITVLIFTGYVMTHYDRDEHMADFIKWISDNGVDLNSIALEKFDGMEYGLKATRDLQACFFAVNFVNFY